MAAAVDVFVPPAGARVRADRLSADVQRSLAPLLTVLRAADQRRLETLTWMLARPTPDVPDVEVR
jgi:hypothetical protein